MSKSFLIKLAIAIIVCFSIGLSLGMLSRNVTFSDSNMVNADILGADIPLSPVPMYKDEQYNDLQKPAAREKQSEQNQQSSQKNSTQPLGKAMIFQAPDKPDEAIAQDYLSCDFEMPKKPVFDARPIKNVLQLKVGAGQKMKIALFFENTGNVPWFSVNSPCAAGPHINLGTLREKDRDSIFYTSDENSGNSWVAKNRIAMQTQRVEPGQIGVFEFISVVPNENDIYREFFGLVAEGKAWMPNSEMMIDFHVGDANDLQENLDKKSLYVASSMPFSKLDLNGQKSIEIDLSEQKMYVHLGDTLIRVFRVSSGKGDTPTPIGNFKIEFKQKVRIAGGDIPYIMPKWQGFYNGAGMHALPSLGNARLRAKIQKLAPDEDAPVEWFKNDSLWTEAISHIGIPVSHGCVRLLPEDANFMYQYTEVGTPVTVRT